MRPFLFAAVAIVSALRMTASAQDAPAPPPAAAPLPEAVSRTIKTAFPSAQIGTVRELRVGEKPELWYNARLTENGHRSDVTVTGEGLLREARAELLPTNIPKPVAEALAANADGGTPLSILRTTTYVNERGRLDPPQVQYMAVLAKDNLLGSIVLGPEGNVLCPAAWKPKQPAPPGK